MYTDSIGLIGATPIYSAVMKLATLPANILLTAACMAMQAELPREALKITPGQRVYVVGAETTSRDLSLAKSNLEIERRAKEQFEKQRTFRLAGALKAADLVFLVIVDPSSENNEEIAIVVSPSDYLAHKSDIDALRDAAVWQSSASSRIKTAKQLAASYNPLRRPSIAKELVKQFHREVLP